MKKIYLSALSVSLVLALIGTNLLADNPNEANEKVAKEEVKEVDIAKVSESFGHLIGKNIENLGFQFDVAQVLKGIRDCTEGKTAPMTEAECIQAITAAQEKAFKAKASENLVKAEEFLSKNSKEKDVVSIEENKLQYKVEVAGDGSSIEPHFSPLIRYKGSYLDGTVFGASKEDEMISLDETIPGLSKALIGMKEGEKRTVFIHPDLGYGTQGYLPPNSLLTFEIECVKANNAEAKEEVISTNAPKAQVKQEAEIATPATPSEVIR